MSTTPPKLSLWFDFWSPIFRPRPALITIAPDSIVYTCKEMILQAIHSPSAGYGVDLYSIPAHVDVPLHGIATTLGSLSLAALGPPIPADVPIGTIVGPEPKPGHLHLLLVNDDTPLRVVCWIHGNDPSNIFTLQMSRGAVVESLLHEIQMKIGLTEAPVLTFYRSSFSTANGPGDQGDQLLSTTMTLGEAFCDTLFSMLPCVIVRKTQYGFKRPFDGDVVEKLKRLKYKAPSTMTTSAYHDLQENSDERFLDFRTRLLDPGALPDKDLPPIEVLFDGFGAFLDVWRGVTQVDATRAMQENVDRFVNSMCRTFSDEISRRTSGLEALNAIFSPALGFPDLIQAGDLPPSTASASQARSDGHYVYGGSRIPCIIVKFKNEGTATAIPIVELVSYYKHMVGYTGLNAPHTVRTSLLPALGITIVGNTITFFGLAYVGWFIYVPLTTTLWCLPIDCGGSDRRQLEVAFTGAFALLARIKREAEALSTGPLPQPMRNRLLPQIHQLARCDVPNSTLRFQITECLSKTLSRHVYKASSSVGPLVIKLTRSYSAELHRICADSGHAPKLYAAQRLPGGYIAVAMGYLDGDSLGSLEWAVPAARRDQWIDELKQLVQTLHDKQFVHGDLRLPNIFCVKDKIMLLDFDWGGKEGEASYPHRRLNAQLTEGCNMTNLKITKEDDKRVLATTLEYIRESILIL